MVAPLVADPTQTTDTANILVLPPLLCVLTEIESYVLMCVATHCWAYGETIPYIVPNAHQRRVALGLAAPGVRLLNASALSRRRYEFWLSRLGALVARRVLGLTPEGLAWQKEREREFDRMRALAYNEWKPFD